MSEITHQNAPGHIQTLYHYVSALAKNHNKIIDHVKNIHGSLKALHGNVKDLADTVNKATQKPVVESEYRTIVPTTPVGPVSPRPLPLSSPNRLNQTHHQIVSK